MAASDLILGFPLYFFGDFRYGVPAKALAGAHKAGEVAPVPVAEALLL